MPTDHSALPLVSVITRTKDRPLLLKRAIESVLNQTYTEWEHIIVNDGGRVDDVQDLKDLHAERYGGRCRVLSNSTSQGMEAASNYGIRESTGQFLAIHDDDDSWDPSFLMECVTFLETPNHPLLRGQHYCGVITQSTRIIERITEDNIVTLSRDPFNDWTKNISLFRMLSGNIFPPISFLFRRSLVDEIGYFREDLPVLGDWDFHLRACLKHEIGVIPKALSNYHHRIPGTSSAYSNTVIDADASHRHFESLYRNKMLRDDIKNGTLGIGVLMALANYLEIIASALNQFRILKEKLLNNKVSKIARKALMLGTDQQQ